MISRLYEAHINLVKGGIVQVWIVLQLMYYYDMACGYQIE